MPADAPPLDLTEAYANAPFIPGGDAYPARWEAEAAAFRSAHPPETLAHGPDPRETTDLWRAPDPRGLVVFVHGGYWKAFSGRTFSHLAQGALARGWSVAMPTYPLCPEASVGATVRSCAAALERAAEAQPGPIRLAGHSAGGQIVARLAGSPLACAARIARVVPVSPVANLLPLLRTEMNAVLALTPEEAAAESPVLRPRPPMPVHVWVGAAERPAFLDQARWLARAWEAPLTEEEGRHHFDVIEGLARPDAALTGAVLAA